MRFVGFFCFWDLLDFLGFMGYFWAIFSKSVRDFFEWFTPRKIRDRCGTYWKIALTTKLLFRLCDNFYLVVDSVTGLRSQKLITKIDHKKDGQPGRVEVAVKAVWR